jgi:predicted TPR repeat methyltransferase
VAERTTDFVAEQFDHAYPDGIQFHYWNQCRNRLIESLVRRHASGARVVDIGCGRGVVVDFLRRRGIDAWGCELATPEPITAEVAPYLEAGCDAVDARASRGARCALILDVLEHLPDPRRFLARITSGIDSLERVIVTVPARPEIWSEWDEVYGHHLRYRRGELRDLLAAAGLEPIDDGYFFHSLYAAARALKTLGRRRATEVQAPKSRLARLAHRAVGAALSIERRVVPSAVPGSSLYAVAAVRR